MDILFCDRCHESIPDADIETGKAVRLGGRVLHVPCALRSAMPGPGRTVVALLAVLAAAGAAYAIGRVESAGPAALPADMPIAWRSAAADEATGRAAKALEPVLTRDRASLRDELSQDILKQLDKIDSAIRGEMRDEVSKLTGLVNGFTAATVARFESEEKRLAELGQWVREVKETASHAQPREPAATPESPAPPSGMSDKPDVPSAPPPAPPLGGPSPSAGAGALDPEAQRRHDQEVDKWVKDLKDPNNGIAFTATYKLKDLKDLRAVPPLVETLQKHKDYFTRLGAAVALGELKACDAVPSLLNAFDDKEDLVQQAAAEAFTSVTGFDPKFAIASTRKERKQIQEICTKWWREHEAEVRGRQGQLAGPPK